MAKAISPTMTQDQVTNQYHMWYNNFVVGKLGAEPPCMEEMLTLISGWRMELQDHIADWDKAAAPHLQSIENLTHEKIIGYGFDHNDEFIYIFDADTSGRFKVEPSEYGFKYASPNREWRRDAMWGDMKVSLRFHPNIRVASIVSEDGHELCKWAVATF